MSPPRSEDARPERQNVNIHLQLARYTATLELYNEIGAQRDLAQVASLLSLRLKYIADVRVYRFIAMSVPAQAGVLPADSAVVLAMGGAEVHQLSFSDLHPAEREVMMRGLPADFQQEENDNAWPFRALPELGACRQIAALPHRLEHGFVSVLLVGHQELLSMIERKVLRSVAQLLCKSVATIWSELAYLELLERQKWDLKRANEDLGQLVESLSMVICPIWDRVVLVPIVGSFDASRWGKLVDRLLTRIHAQGVGHVVLDLTGVVAIDPEICPWLTSLSEMLELLGARCIIVGLSAAAAATLAASGRMPSRALFRASIRDAMQIFCTTRA